VCEKRDCVVCFAFIVSSIVCLCPTFDIAPYNAVKCKEISDHRLCISAALDSFEDGCGSVKTKGDIVAGGQVPAVSSNSSVNCQMRAAQIRVHVLYHGKNSSLGDGGDCHHARVAFLNDTCSHFPTCAAEACILAGFGPVNHDIWASGGATASNQTSTTKKPIVVDEVTIKHKDYAKMLMPRSDLRRFAGVLGLNDPDEFWNNRGPKLSDEMEVLPVEIPLVDPSIGGEIQQELTKAAIRHASRHNTNNNN